MSCKNIKIDNYARSLALNRLGISRHMNKVREDWLDDSSSSDGSSDGSVYNSYPNVCSDDFISKCSFCNLGGNSHHCSAVFIPLKKECLICAFDWPK
jgi:hypothetical protein